eukprot:sb/3467683/
MSSLGLSRAKYPSPAVIQSARNKSFPASIKKLPNTKGNNNSSRKRSRTLIENSFTAPSVSQNDVIDSFESSSSGDEENRPPTKNARKLPCNKKLRCVPARVANILPDFQPSPPVIDSFESSDSSVPPSPPSPVRLPQKVEKKPPSVVGHLTLKTRQTVSKRVSDSRVTTDNNKNNKVSDKFSDFFPTKPASSLPPSPRTPGPTPSVLGTPSTRKSTSSWLESLKSPKKKASPTLGKRKDKAKRYEAGSLAHRAQTQARFTTGEYLMWLHKNIATASTLPSQGTAITGE